MNTRFKIGHIMTQDIREKISKSLLGIRKSKDTRIKMSFSSRGRKKPSISGKNHWNWQGGKTDEGTKIRNSIEYRKWREEVFNRDNWTCVECRSRGIKLHADHIQPFALYPELRFDVNNGRTLCIPCHELTPTYLKKLKT